MADIEHFTLVMTHAVKDWCALNAIKGLLDVS